MRARLVPNAEEIVQVLHAPWNYHEQLNRTRGVISHWAEREKISKKAMASLERALDQLRQLPMNRWERPHASKIGDHTFVIRFTDVKRVQLRVFGHFYQPHKSFVMTGTGSEKDYVYTPKNYAQIAADAREVCIQDFARRTKSYLHYCDLC